MATTSNTRVAATQELSERCTHIRQLMAANTTNFHAIGVEYNTIVDNKLAEKAGYKNAPEYLCQQIQELSRASLVRYGAVARAFTPEVCVQYGVSILSALLTYVEAAGAELDAQEPGSMIIHVPHITGEVEDKLFAECSVEEVRKAIQRLRRPTSSTPLPPDVDARAQECGSTWTAWFPKNSGVRVEVHNRKGQAVLNLKDVPLEQMEQLAALLKPSLRSVRAA